MDDPHNYRRRRFARYLEFLLHGPVPMIAVNKPIGCKCEGDVMAGFDFFNGTREEFEAHVQSHPEVQRRAVPKIVDNYWSSLVKCRQGEPLVKSAVPMLALMRDSQMRGELRPEVSILGRSGDWSGGALQSLVFGFVEIVDVGVPMVPRFVRLTRYGERYLDELIAADVAEALRA